MKPVPNLLRSAEKSAHQQNNCRITTPDSTVNAKCSYDYFQFAPHLPRVKLKAETQQERPIEPQNGPINTHKFLPTDTTPMLPQASARPHQFRRETTSPSYSSEAGTPKRETHIMAYPHNGNMPPHKFHNPMNFAAGYPPFNSHPGGHALDYQMPVIPNFFLGGYSDYRGCPIFTYNNHNGAMYFQDTHVTGGTNNVITYNNASSTNTGTNVFNGPDTTDIHNEKDMEPGGEHRGALHHLK